MQTLAVCRQPIRKMKRIYKVGEISAATSATKKSVSRIYKELMHFNSKKPKIQLEKGLKV